jgi:hypothetical protein
MFLIVTSVQVRKNELHAEAVALFESKSKGRRLTPGQRDKLWNDAEQEAMAQCRVLPEQVLVDARNTRTRTARTTKLRIGDAWFNVSQVTVSRSSTNLSYEEYSIPVNPATAEAAQGFPG